MEGNGAKMGSADPGAPLRGSGNPPATFSIRFQIPTGALRDRLAFLGGEGFVDAGEQYAITLLENNSVRHLRPYLDVEIACPGEHGPSLARAHDVMHFDRQISAKLLKHVGVLESRLRASYSCHVEDSLGELALYDESNFLRWDNYFKTMSAFQRDVGKRADKDESLRGQLRDGGGKLPVSEAVEHMSFSTLFGFFANTASLEVTGAVSGLFNSTKSELVNWLKCVMAARNAFAHFAPFIVRSQLWSVPLGIRGVDYDRRKPFYLVPLMMRLVADDPRFVGPDYNQGDWFVDDVGIVIKQFWDEHEDLARYVGIPDDWVGLVCQAGDKAMRPLRRL